MELLSEGINTDAKDMQIVHTLSAQKVQSWAFGDELVRTIQIENAPFFVAKDVSIALGYKNATDLTRSLESDEIINCIIPTSGGNQEMLVINEPGLYHAIFMSRKTEVKTFRRWVTEEVLPAIRRTGSFGPAAQPITLEEFEKFVDRVTDRISALEQNVVRTNAIKSDEPDFSDARESVVVLVKKAAKENCMSEREVWSDLYRSYERITGIPLMKSAKALNMSVISYVDVIGRMESLNRFAEQVLWFV